MANDTLPWLPLMFGTASLVLVGWLIANRVRWAFSEDTRYRTTRLRVEAMAMVTFFTPLLYASNLPSAVVNCTAAAVVVLTVASAAHWFVIWSRRRKLP